MTIPLLADSPAALDALSRVEILYTDLDGTLLGLGGSLLVDAEGQPALQTAEAVNALNLAGLPVVLATGRNRIQCTEISRLLGWRGFVAELGCVIVPDRGADPIYFTGDWPCEALAAGETPYERIIRAGAVEALVAAFPGKLEPHAPYHVNREATVLLRGSLDVEEAREVLGELDVAVTIVDNGIIHPLATGLVNVAEVHAYHLMPPGVAKSGAIERDLARRGLAREQAAAIGDAATDVAMADAVALGVVVANAQADARVQAAALTRNNVYAASRERGEGWAEFAAAWLAARGAR
ncbi:MAG: HAD hydrolase family protein [Coriobacteriia bacterium]|nr:HAD hydrolase family protein [Coriobacteriia bacterium]